MAKVFGKVGTSLGDVYDVQGSQLGIEQLDTDTVGAVHEMGTTIFSERLSGEIFRFPFDDIGQNVTLGGAFPGLPVSVFRLAAFAMLVESGLTARLTRMTASLSSLDAAGDATQELPFFAWDATLGTSESVRVFDDGATSNFDMLIPAPSSIPQLPQLLTGSLQRGVVNGIAMRGLSSAFGAGTVNIIGLAYILHPDASGSGISSQGLPIPSW